MKMKQFRLWMLCIGILLSCMASAQEYTCNGIVYSIDSRNLKCSVKKLSDNSYEGHLEIPNTIKYDGQEYAVTSINTGAFTDCPNLESVFIPSNIEDVTSPFKNCPKLYKISVDSRNNVYDSREACNAIIETSCDRLVVACNGTVIPSSVRVIGRGAYDGYTKSTLEFPHDDYHYLDLDISNPLFNSHGNVKYISMPANMDRISASTFSNFDGYVSFYKDYYGNCDKIEKDGHIYSCAPTPWGNWTENGLIYKGNTFISNASLGGLFLSNRCEHVIIGWGIEGANDMVVPASVSVIDIDPFVFTYARIPRRMAFLSTTPPEVRVNNAQVRTDFVEEIHVPKGARNAYVSDAFFSLFNIIDDIETPANFTGKCGENATYTMDLSGGVYISGTGEADLSIDFMRMLEDFWRSYGIYVEKIPVYISDGASIKFSPIDVYIEDGITSVKSGEIYSPSSLRYNSISFPQSVESISNLHDVQYIYGDYMNSNFRFENGVVYDSEKKSIVACSQGKMGELEIPSGVTSIDDRAFDQNYGLTKVVIPDGVTSIGREAFSGCVSLAEVNIPNGVTSIGISAFYLCSSLTEINIPGSVTSIGSSAFYGCSSLTEINIPGSVTKIGSDAFNGCSELTYIDIPSGVTNIEYRTFANCTNLSRVSIPNNVTSIGSSAFADCKSLTSVTIPGSVTSIEGNAFEKCIGLTSLTIPQNVTTIGSAIIKGCCNIKKLVVDARNTEYDSRNNCNAIIETKTNALIAGCNTTVIPEDIASIGNNAFYNCKELTDVNIPSGVTSIGYNAFNGCEAITRIDIPSGVTSIGSLAFCNCKNLATISVMSETPLKLSSGIISSYMKKTCTLIVPQGCLNAYKQADVWKDFANIIEVETDIALLDNAIYVENVEAIKGNDVELAVKLKNSTMDVTAFAFNLVLPQGFSVTKVTRGERVKAMNDDDEYVFTFQNSDIDGVRYVQAYNTENAVLSGKDGEIVRITISMPEDVPTGEYPILITDGEISYHSECELNDMVRSTLTVKEFIVGDANGDGRVSISDVSALASYLLSRDADGVVLDAMDANGDGRVSITDVSALANTLLGK